jgi:hypothetical protein
MNPGVAAIAQIWGEARKHEHQQDRIHVFERPVSSQWRRMEKGNLEWREVLSWAWLFVWAAGDFLCLLVNTNVKKIWRMKANIIARTALSASAFEVEFAALKPTRLRALAAQVRLLWLEENPLARFGRNQAHHWRARQSLDPLLNLDLRFD